MIALSLKNGVNQVTNFVKQIAFSNWHFSVYSILKNVYYFKLN